MQSMLKTAAAGLMLVALAGTTGCATNSDLEKVEAELAQVSATADKAAADAASAKADAAAARAAAEDAAASARDTNEKLDRMFKKSMYK